MFIVRLQHQRDIPLERFYHCKKNYISEVDIQGKKKPKNILSKPLQEIGFKDHGCLRVMSWLFWKTVYFQQTTQFLNCFAIN